MLAKRKKCCLAGVLSAVMLLMLLLTGCAEKPAKVVILYTNDVHCSIGQYPVFAAYAAELKEQGQNVLLADGGDATHGSYVGWLDQGASVIRILNAVGYDLFVPGNHDYDYGMDTFLHNAANSDFTYLTCNFGGTQEQSEQFAHQPFCVRQWDGHKAAFVGIEHSNDSCTEQVQSAVDAARNEGAEVVIAIGHTGTKPTQTLIESTNGIDIYLNAHDHAISDGKEHSLSYTNSDGKSVPVFETGTAMAYVLRLDLEMRADGFSYTAEMKTPEELNAELGSRPSSRASAVMEKVQRESALINELVEIENAPIGTSECVLCVYDPARFPECTDFYEYNTSNMIADAFRTVAGTDVGIVNTDATRKGLQKGAFGRLDLCDLAPWFEKIYAVELTGRQLLHILERGTANFPAYTQHQPAVSGMTFRVDSAKSTDRVCDVQIGGKPLVPDKVYSLASSSYYLFEANSDVFGTEESAGRCIDEDNAVIERYVTEHLGSVIPAALYGNPSGEGRIQPKDG